MGKLLYHYPIYRIFLLFMLIPMIALSFIGCGSDYETYREKVDGVEFSFQYPKNVSINPPNPWARINWVHPPNINYDSHINVIAIKVSDTNISNSDIIDNFISSYNNNEYLSDFNIEERGLITIADANADYITYSYTGYTTVPSPYLGKFLTFSTKGLIFEIDLLFEWVASDTDEAFDLLIETFTIE